jgi:hypothetical protein
VALNSKNRKKIGPTGVLPTATAQDQTSIRRNVSITNRRVGGVCRVCRRRRPALCVCVCVCAISGSSSSRPPLLFRRPSVSARRLDPADEKNKKSRRLSFCVLVFLAIELNFDRER